MVLAAEVKSELEEELELEEIVTEENCVIGLTNTGNMDISNSIAKVGRSTSVDDFDTKVRLVWNRKLFVIHYFVPVTTGHTPLLQPTFVLNRTHEYFLPLAKCDSVLQSSEDEREILVASAIKIEAPSQDFEENKIKSTLCIKEESVDWKLQI